MKQLHVVVDAYKVNPHKIQLMLDELSLITTVRSNGIIEYDETDIELEQQIYKVVQKYFPNC